MSGLAILVLASVAFVLAYFLYGRWIVKHWGINPDEPTPAHTMEDGVDYVPASRSVVFGHQFASIAGAGPINGPIIAAMFGWVPVFLWIIFGGIFFGAVQDLAALYASVKSKGKTIGYIIELYIGKTGKTLFLLFTWLFSILVIAAFADIVAVTFNSFAPDGALLPAEDANAKAAAASTSLIFMFAAVVLGYYLRYKKPGSYTSSAVAVGFLAVCIALGILFPIYLDKTWWLYGVFAYCFVASVTPVWILLQPRDYMNSFLLLIMIAASFVGVVFANPEMNIAPFTAFEVNGMSLFPILFVTVACGAISGFHALVASGTASKQIDNERDILPVSFGGMLVECLLAVLALVAVGSLAVGGTLPTGSPLVIFSTAIRNFLATLGLPADIVFAIITLCVSAFALTTIDSVTRIGRLAFQELFTGADADAKRHPLVTVLLNRYVATAITLVFGYLLALRGYADIWPLFGSANQMLGGLALLACAVFLKHTNRKGWMLYIPMISMLVITFSALTLTILKLLGKIGTEGGFNLASDGLQLAFGVILLLLGVLVAISGVKKLSGAKAEIPSTAS